MSNENKDMARQDTERRNRCRKVITKFLDEIHDRALVNAVLVAAKYGSAMGLQPLDGLRLDVVTEDDIHWDGQGFSSGDRLEPSALARKVLEAAEQDQRPTPWNTTPQHEETAMTENTPESCECGHFTRLANDPATLFRSPCPKCHTLVKHRPVTEGVVIDAGHPCPDCAHLGDDAGFYVGAFSRETCQTCDGDKWIFPEAPPVTLPPEGEASFKTQIEENGRMTWADGRGPVVMIPASWSHKERVEQLCPMRLVDGRLREVTTLSLMAYLYRDAEADHLAMAVKLDGRTYTPGQAFNYMLGAGHIGTSKPKEPPKRAYNAYSTYVGENMQGPHLYWPSCSLVSDAEFKQMASDTARVRHNTICPINIHGKRPRDSFILGMMEFLHPGAIILPAQQCIRLPDGMKYTVGKVFDIMKRDGVFGDSAP